MADLLADIPPTRPIPRGRHGAAGPVAGLTARRLDRAVATVAARRGQTAETIAALAGATGVVAVDRPVAVTTATTTAIGIGPGRWTVVAEMGSAGLLAALAPLAGIAAVVDQSGGQVVFRLAGPRLPCVLAKLMAVDVDPGAAPVGAAVTTSVAHIGVTAWRAEDDAWVLVVGRSHALAFERAIVAAAAEFGVVLQD